MGEFLGRRPEQFLAACWQHLGLTALATVIALVLVLPLGPALPRGPLHRLGRPALVAAGIGEGAPAIGLMALLACVLGFGGPLLGRGPRGLCGAPGSTGLHGVAGTPAVGGQLPCSWMIAIFCHTFRAMSDVRASMPSTASSTSASVVSSANSAAVLPTSESISVQ